MKTHTYESWIRAADDHLTLLIATRVTFYAVELRHTARHWYVAILATSESVDTPDRTRNVSDTFRALLGAQNAPEHGADHVRINRDDHGIYENIRQAIRDAEKNPEYHPLLDAKELVIL